MPGRKKYGKRKLAHRQKWTNRGFNERKKLFPNAAIGVAEGDSWFDYSPAWFEFADLKKVRGDLLAQLCQTGKYNIWRVSDGGDTLDNMVYGNEYNKKTWEPNREQQLIKKTIPAIKKYDPKFFLFSAGGNDFAGPEFEMLLHHKKSGKGPLREDAINELLNVVFREGYVKMIETILNENSCLPIFIHGYGKPEPTGKGVINFPGGWRFVGPWLRPALAKRGYNDEAEMRKIVVDVINRFNDLLSSVAHDFSQVHYIDLRTTINKNDWINELHLNTDGWAKVAKKFDQVISNNL